MPHPTDNSIVPGTPPDGNLEPVFRELCDVVARLRSPTGCPWDRQQTLETIKPFTLEETYELLEAIDSGNDAAISEELGDVLLQVVLDSQIAADEGRFALVEVIRNVTQKLVSRHPHVFGDEEAKTAAAVKHAWDRIKQQEKRRDSILDGIAAELPQLARAARITEKAARVGFDFPNRVMLFDKLREEVSELAVELFPGGTIPEIPADVDGEIVPDSEIADLSLRDRIESEIGDLLFVIANIARRWHVNPEEALRRSNRKFSDRFRYIEARLKEQGRDIRSSTLREMEDLYQERKSAEKAQE